MFTFRLNSYRSFQYLLILFFVSRAVSAGQTPKKCAAVNEYCQNHWDCCSNSCMSYMYRCSRGYNSYPYSFLGVSYKPSVTLDDILEQNFGSSSNSIPAYQPKPYFVSRFGGADEEATSTEVVQIVLQKKSEETTTTTSETTTLKNPVELPEATAALENRLGEDTKRKDNDHVLPTTEATIVTSSTVKPSCSEIGIKCYTNDECCSKRCHGFLHQCVT